MVKFDHHAFNSLDEMGNRIICHENGFLYLILRSDGKERSIGQIFPHDHQKDKLVYYKHEKESEVFQKTDAWSIPYWILEKVDFVCFVTEKFIYKILASKAKEHGSFLWFKVSGFEKKIYVPREYWWKGKR